MTLVYKTKPLCTYPDCKAIGHKTWSLAPLCIDHFIVIRDETALYYGHRIQRHERVHYLKIEPAVVAEWVAHSASVRKVMKK